MIRCGGGSTAPLKLCFAAGRPPAELTLCPPLPVTATAVKRAVARGRSTEGAARDQKEAPTPAKTTKKKSTANKRPALVPPSEMVATPTAVEPAKETIAMRAESAVMKTSDKPSTSRAQVASITAEPAKKAPPRRKPGDAPSTRPALKVSPEERLQFIAEAAYYIAERRGFAPGYEHENWLEAEAEVEQRLRASAEAPHDDETEEKAGPTPEKP